MDLKKAEEAVRELLQKGLGLDLSNPNLCGTPERVARMYTKEFLASCYESPKENLTRSFPNEKNFDEIVMFDNIPFTSLCSHHLLPFSGLAWFLYIPDKVLLGASKPARIIDYFSRTPQLQENLASEIIDFIEAMIAPKGSMLVMRAVHGCFDGETEILTEAGWVRFDSLSKIRKVVQVDPLTLEADLVYPTDYIEYINEIGVMHHYKNRRVDIFETPNHRMLIKSEWKNQEKSSDWVVVKSEDTPGAFYVPTAFTWKGEKLNIPNFGIDISEEDFVSFMGLYLSEGSLVVDRKNNKNEEYIGVNITQKNGTRDCCTIEVFLNKVFGAGVHKYVSNGYTQFYIRNKLIGEYCSQFGRYCTEMFVPTEIKNASPMLITKFLEWFYLGDGDKWHKGRKELGYSDAKLITTSSLKLAVDLQEIYAKVGVSMTLHRYENKTYQKSKNKKIGTKYKLWEQKGKSRKQQGKSYVRKGRDFKEVSFKKKVYCVTVPKGAIVIKRNDKITVIGNCMSCRGVKTGLHAGMTVSITRGIFRTSLDTRTEALNLIQFSLKLR